MATENYSLAENYSWSFQKLEQMQLFEVIMTKSK